jgi:transcriptional regulator with XRE-family HTH domain
MWLYTVYDRTPAASTLVENGVDLVRRLMASVGADGMVITIMIGIARRNPLRLSEMRREFDGAAFARNISEARRRLQLSTRDVARIAGISQAYVVALERPRTSHDAPGPTPTLDVAARLAYALDLDPIRLIADGLRAASRHALLVVDDARRPVVDAMRKLAGPAVDAWIAARPTSAPRLPSDGSHTVQLRTNLKRPYQPTSIAASLNRELKRLAPVIDGATVGLVFAEMSEVMATLKDPSSVIAFEDSWARVVANAAARVGARAEWNVCVYEIAALRALPDPVGAAVSLMRTHDTVLAIHNDRMVSGHSGVRRIVSELRPPTESVRVWRATTDRVIADLAS